MINCLKKFFGKKEEVVDTNTKYNVTKSRILYVSNKDICSSLNVSGTKYYKLENEEINIYFRCRYFGSGNKRTREILFDLLESINKYLDLDIIKNIPNNDDEIYAIDINPFINFKYIDFVHYEFERAVMYLGFTIRGTTEEKEISGIIEFKNASKDCMIKVKNYIISKGDTVNVK